MKRAILFSIWFSLALASISALDVRDGLVRVATDDLTLRPMLYRLVNVAGKSKYEPLWYDGDPRTSFIVLDVDNRIYRLGSSKEYQTTQRRLPNGIEIEYRSITSRLTQRITFAALAGSRISNGFTVELEVENYTSRDMKVKLKEVCDTWLGEQQGDHFALKTNPKVVDELALDRSSNEPYIVSPGQNASVALLLDIPASPDTTVIANWKRLSDAPFGYGSEFMRGFTLAPYSANDSALGLFWNESIVPAKGIISVRSLWLSGGPGREFVPWLAENYPPQQKSGDNGGAQGSPLDATPSPQNPDVPVEPSSSAAPAQAEPASFDVSDLQTLIEKIDDALKNIEVISDSDVDTLLNQLNALKEKGGAPSGPVQQ